jgi:hypothetical protein
MKKAIAIALGLCVALGLPALAADDDLEVVKRATQAAPQVEATPAAKAAPASTAAQAARGEKPTWFKVEVYDKASGKRRVSVNLPLAVVEIFGDEVPVHWSCGDKSAAKEPHCGLKLKEVLAQLQKGQPLVEIEKETERIRVWVE